MYLNNWNAYINKFNQNDEEIWKQMLPNDRAMDWVDEEVPRFECPDKEIEETYYFRWWLFRKHIKETGEGRIITEFLPQVSWSGAYNSINCASSHHLSEARWLVQDRKLSSEYLHFWFRGTGNEYSYSSWLVYTAYEQALVSGDTAAVTSLLPDFIAFYREVETRNFTKYGLFWSDDDRDAMEMSISGSGLRPTLNSYMYGNALAISRIAGWAGDKDTEAAFLAKAMALKEKMLELLWDPQEQFFKVIHQEQKDDEIPSLDFQKIPKQHNVREAIGYIPWSFDIPAPEQDEAWKFLRDPEYFKAPFGPTTAERSHPEFMKHCPTHECLWNGPSWPFSTTQVLNSMIRVLQKRDEHNSPWISRQDFIDTLHTYAASHYRLNEDGKKVNWLDENIEPDSGKWLSREILKDWNWRENKGGYERGKDYNHSAFCDLVIRGICGVMLTEENEITIDSLLPWDVWEYFMVENLPYKGHLFTIAYDRDGSRYGNGRGLWVAEKGNVLRRTESPGSLTVKL